MGISALILAAGAGRRLGFHDRPKVLTEVAGVPLLVRLLRQLARLEVSDVTIAVGAHRERVIEVVLQLALPMPVHFVENAAYGETNNSYTLQLCGGALGGGCLLLEGDVAVDDEILRDVVASAAPDVWAVRSPGNIRDGAFLEADARGCLRKLEIVKLGDPVPPGYKSTGILKLSPSLGRALRDWLDAEIAVRRDRYYDLVIADHLAEANIHLLLCDRGRWIEIDSPDDLAQAQQMFGSP